MFDANTKVGDVSNTTYRCGDDFVVVSLSAINPKGDKTLESVRDIIIQEIQTDQKFDDISSKLSGSPTLEEASSLSDPDTVYIASEVNFESLSINNTITDVLDVQNFVGAVNALDEGETSRLIKGNNAAYLIYIVSKGSGTEYTESEKDKIRQENSFGAYYEALKILKENSDIVKNFGKQLSMHIAASNPLALESSLIDKSIIDKEQELVTEELKNSGKPEDIAKKISLGKMNKFKEENALLTQAWVMEPKKKVQDILKELAVSDLKIKEFSRIKIGE